MQWQSFSLSRTRLESFRREVPLGKRECVLNVFAQL